jgi:hypothetical protein
VQGWKRKAVYLDIGTGTVLGKTTDALVFVKSYSALCVYLRGSVLPKRFPG